MSSLKPIVIPKILPVPIPGGGPQDGYQWAFNERYYATRKSVLRPLFFGLAAGLDPAMTPLSDEDQAALANRLYDWVAPGGPGVYGPNHVDFDQECDFQRWDPYTVEYMRQQIYGYQRVPIGTGTTTQPPNVVNAADLQGPAVPGHYLLVTCDADKL